jgi:ribulose-phosphate 3-epimerase
MSKIRIAPSILSADFANLGAEIRAIETAGADWVHVDVMDGVFVPNLTLGPPVIRNLRKHTKLPFDVHLMMVEPERHLASFSEAGADHILVHVEAATASSTHLDRTLRQIRDLGKRSGIVLNPHTSEHTLEYLLELCDVVLLMSVNPGFGGQAFLPSVVRKAERVSAMRARLGLTFDLEVDGGVGTQNIASLASVGVDVVVAGNAVFQGGPEKYAANIQALRMAVEHS